MGRNLFRPAFLPWLFDRAIFGARFDAEEAPVGYAPRTPEGVQLLANHTGRVKTYFANVAFGPCPSCLSPVAIFSDGRALSWPTLAPHVEGIADAAPLQPASRPAVRPAATAERVRR